MFIFGSDCPAFKILTTVSNSQALTALDSGQGKSSARHSKLDSVQVVRQPGTHSVRFCPGKFISQALTTSDYVQGVHQPGTHSVRFCPGKFIRQALTTLDSVQGVHQPGTHSVRFCPGRSSARHSHRWIFSEVLNSHVLEPRTQSVRFGPERSSATHLRR